MSIFEESDVMKITSSEVYYVQRFSRVFFGIEFSIILFLFMTSRLDFGWETVFVLVIFLMSIGWLWGDITKNLCINKIWRKERSIKISSYIVIVTTLCVALVVNLLRSIDLLSIEGHNFIYFLLIFFAIIHLFYLSSKMRQGVLLHCSVDKS